MRECPVLYPTLDDIRKPFEAFIEKHEKKIAQAGIAKIVAPEGWSPRRQGYPDDLDFTIERPIRQHATGSRGLYRGLYIEEKPMTLRRGFRPQALAPENLPPPASDPRDLERKYWKNVTLRPPLYGADVLGSLFDEDCEAWSLRRLDTVLSRVLAGAGHSLPGVSEPYLYFGMWRSTFAWHTEDMDLYSVNYLHYGAPKQWYCIPPDSRKRFEGLVKGMLPDLFKACPEFFRHKELIISPQLLDTFAIPYIKTVQHPREFVINYPGAYHAGYNCGYNCAESVNFGTRRWVPLGAMANVCRCNPDSVSIDMRLFRDLVPARLLPPSIFEDTSSDEDDEEEEDSDSEEGSSEEGGVDAAKGNAASRGSGRHGRGGGGRTGGGRAMAGAVRLSAIVDAAAEAAVPRRRGRPPKRPLLAAGATADSTAAALPESKRQCVEHPNGANAGGEAAGTAPRRRGRPPKVVKMAAVTAQQNNGTHCGASGGDVDGAAVLGMYDVGNGRLPVALLPGRRGRPPKRPTPEGGSGGSAAAGATGGGSASPHGASAGLAAAPAPVKRPRGRPRKHLLPVGATAVPGVVAVAPSQVVAVVVGTVGSQRYTPAIGGFGNISATAAEVATPTAAAAAVHLPPGCRRKTTFSGSAAPLDVLPFEAGADGGGGDDSSGGGDGRGTAVAAAAATSAPGDAAATIAAAASAAGLAVKRPRGRPRKLPRAEPRSSGASPDLDSGSAAGGMTDLPCCAAAAAAAASLSSSGAPCVAVCAAVCTAPEAVAFAVSREALAAASATSEAPEAAAAPGLGGCRPHSGLRPRHSGGLDPPPSLRGSACGGDGCCVYAAGIAPAVLYDAAGPSAEKRCVTEATEAASLPAAAALAEALQAAAARALEATVPRAASAAAGVASAPGAGVDSAAVAAAVAAAAAHRGGCKPCTMQLLGTAATTDVKAEGACALAAATPLTDAPRHPHGRKSIDVHALAKAAVGGEGVEREPGVRDSGAGTPATAELTAAEGDGRAAVAEEACGSARSGPRAVRPKGRLRDMIISLRPVLRLSLLQRPAGPSRPR